MNQVIFPLSQSARKTFKGLPLEYGFKRLDALVHFLQERKNQEFFCTVQFRVLQQVHSFFYSYTEEYLEDMYVFQMTGQLWQILDALDQVTVSNRLRPDIYSCKDVAFANKYPYIRDVKINYVMNFDLI